MKKLLLNTAILLSLTSCTPGATLFTSATGDAETSTTPVTLTEPTSGASAPLGLTFRGACDNSRPVVVSGTGAANPGSYSCVNNAYSIPVAFTAGEGAKEIKVSQTNSRGITQTVGGTYQRTPHWAPGDTKLRWAPPTLVNPVELGVAAVEGRPGTGVYTAPLNIHWDGSGYTAKPEQDVLVRGMTIVNGGQRFPYRFVGGRNYVLMGGEFTPAAGRAGKVNPRDFTKEFYIEGIRMDYEFGAENDAVFIEQMNGALNPDVTIQRVHFKGMHGTNKPHYPPINVVSVSAAGLVTSAAPHGLVAGTSTVIIAETTLDGHNRRFAVTSTPSATTLVIGQLDPNVPVPTQASTGGRMWGQTPGASGQSGAHADAVQVNDLSRVGAVRIDSATFETSYDTIILGRRAGIDYGNRKTIISRLNVRRNPINPHDNANVNMFFGDVDDGIPASSYNGRRNDVELTDVWGLPWPGGKGLLAEDPTRIVFPSGNATYDGIPVGAFLTTHNGIPAFEWPQLSPDIKIVGRVYIGAPAQDYALWGTPGNDVPGRAYVNTVGYADQFQAVPIQNITLSNTLVEANLAAGESIGWIDVPYPVRGYVIDVTLDSDLDGQVALVGANLVRGANPLTAGMKNLNLTATISRDVAGNAVNPPVVFHKTIVLGVGPNVQYASTFSGDLGSPSSDLNGRSITISGPGLVAYKALLLKNVGSCAGANFDSVAETPAATPFTLSPSGDGSYILCVIGRNSAGQWQSSVLESSTVVIDTVAPAIAITEPSTTLLDSVTQITVRGTCEAPFDVAVAGDITNPMTTACGAGTFAATVDLTGGTGNKTISASQTDNAGNVGTGTRVLSRVGQVQSANLIFASFGDSRIANYSDVVKTNPALFGSTKIIGIQEWAIRHSGGKLRFPTAHNYALGGDTTSAAPGKGGMLAKVQAAIPALQSAGVGNALLLAGAANWGLNRSDSQGAFNSLNSAGDIQQAAGLLRNAGIVVFIIAELPTGDDANPSSKFSGTALTNHLDYRNRLLAMHNPAGGIYVIGEAWDFLVDDAALATMKPGYAPDARHPNWQGAYWIGKAVAASTVGVVPASSFALPTTNSDVYNASTNPTGNLIANPMMTANTGATVATGYTVSATAGITTATSLVNIGGAVWQEVSYSGTVSTGTTGIVTVYNSMPLASIDGGDQMDFAAAVQMEPGAVGAASLAGELRFSYTDAAGNANQSFIPVAGDRANTPDITPAEKQNFVLRTDRVQMPLIYNNGHPTIARAGIVIRVPVNTSVSGTFRVRAFSVVKNRAQ